MGYTVDRVVTKRELKEFVHFSRQIYKNDPYWVPPLFSEQLKFLDKKKGVFFEFGEAEYFLVRKDGALAGRLSAHISRQWDKYHDPQTGFFGFFECINDQQAANALFAEAAKWLRSRGKNKILGPFSFTTYDECAMLVDGYDSSPVIMLSYNPPYYNDLVTNAGFTKAIDWYAFRVNKDVQIRPVFYKVRERLLNNTDFRVENMDLKKLDVAIQRVGKIFNDAWMENWGHVPLTEGQLKSMAAELKLVAVPELSYFAFEKDECIGFSLTLLDANPAIKKANGRLFPFGIFKIMLAMKKIKRLRTIAMGVLKEHRHRGLDVLFYLNTVERGVQMGYTESECSIIVETNTRMIGALEDLEAKRYKTYRFYEKEI